MSVEATNWVWKQSASRGPARLVLLALADYANDQHQAWPAMKTLTTKTALGERTVHRAITQLIKMGELRIEYNAGPGLCNLYQIILTPVSLTPPSERHPRQPDTPAAETPPSERHPTPARAAPKGVPERHPEPSVEPSRNRIPPSADATPAVITPIPTAQTFVAAYVDAYRAKAGHDPPRQVKGQVAKHLREAFEDGIHPDTIKAGFVDWFDQDKHPATLPSFIEVAGRGGQPRARPTRNQQQRAQLIETDQYLDRWAEQREGGDSSSDPDGMETRGPQDRRQLARPGTTA